MKDLRTCHKVVLFTKFTSVSENIFALIMIRLEAVLKLFFCISFVLTSVQSVRVNEFLDKDLTISQDEKKVLDKLLISTEKHLTHDYMKKEIYLIRWVRAAKSNLEDAKQLVLEHIRWRAENKVDNIIYEDFGTIKYEFPVKTDAVDYFGAPVFTVNVEDWDIRRGILSGQTDKIYRYLLSHLEKLYARLRTAQDNGKNVTRMHIIEDMTGYNLVEHACLACLAVQIRFLTATQVHYPGLLGYFVYINTPPFFEVPLRTLLPAASEENQKALKMFGTNRKEWEGFISGFVSPDQLETNFGGTKEMSYDFE